MRGNRLTGEIPASLGFLSILKVLGVYNNSLRGTIPPSLGRNEISCIVPVSIFNLSNLITFDIGTNKIQGFLHSDSEITLPYVEFFSIAGNQVSGQIPVSISNASNLNVLQFAENKFRGDVPSLEKLDKIFMSLQECKCYVVEGNNKLCGGIPELNLSRYDWKKISNTSVRLKIAIIIVILGVTLVFTCLLILWVGKKKEQNPPSTCAKDSLLQLSYQIFLRVTTRFATQNLVGLGNFGSVYKGYLEERIATIAVKEDWLHPSITMNESETMRNLNFYQRVNVVVDVVHALEYLHHRCETSIINCDLKPSNILLDVKMVGHIIVFGLAKVLYEDGLNHPSNQSRSLGIRGTIGYAPPEYDMGCELSTKGDVYSYGILLLEMFTGKRPTDEIFKEGLSIHNFVSDAFPDRMVEIIDHILLQECLTCSAEQPSEWMGMGDVVTKFCSARDKLFLPTRFRRGFKLHTLLKNQVIMACCLSKILLSF
ncbi:hypothetical protein F3Y22_tig00111877pilonHSYRG00227 [Hibiscus syriacus]|uniref:non-specific serine/threonine protein kinase n=1 Tax=Hibiscus syriacus TaxID=106335 RepID=A0A6A2X9L0_HIBSY|nr:hypothetical protein F3Y22_tig00111877pilonHSYRG00227 [Hibiscus syriacus]